MDWGIGIGLQGLYGKSNYIERNKNEMAAMDSMDAMKMRKDAMNEQAQLKEQAYMEEISKFADTLLGPDRDKINEKAKFLQARMKEKVSYYGGDMQKFFADGGHKFIGDYKRSLISSPETTQYMENKKNMTMLLEMMSKKQGHLINARDYQSLVDYQNNGGGIVSFTGMYNEIQLPDLEAYDYGTEIPAQDILDQNYVAIYGNYIIDNPDKADLDPQDLKHDLLAYTQMNYGGKGKNWQRQQKALEERNRHQESMVKLINENLKIKQGAKTKKMIDVNGNEVEVYDDTQPEDKDYTNLLSNNILRGIHSVAPAEKKFTLDEFMKGYDTKDKHEFNENFEAINPGSLVAEHIDMSESGFEDTAFKFFGKPGRGTANKNSILPNLFDDYFVPANAYAVKGLQPHKDKIGAMFFNGLKVVNGKIIGLTPTNDMFLPNGASLDAHAKKENPLITSDYTGDYTIKNVFIGGVTETKDGKEIVMNKTNSKGEVDKDWMKDAKEKYFGEIKGNQLIVQVEDDKGQVFYKAMEYTPALSQKINGVLGGDNQLAHVDKDYNQKSINQQFQTKLSQEEKQVYQNSWDVVDKQAGNIFKQKTSEAIMLSPQGTYDQESANLVKSYYVALASMIDGQIKDANTLKQLIETPGSSVMNIVKGAKDEGYDVKTKMAQGASALEVIDGLIKLETQKEQPDPINTQVLDIWKKNMMYLNSLGK